MPTRQQRDDRGASAVEYGLIVFAVAAIVAVAVFALGVLNQELFQDSTTCIANRDSASCS